MEKSRTLVLMASMRSPTIGSPDQTLAPLSSGAREWGGLFGEQGSVDDVGEPAFEDAEGFHTAVAVVFCARRAVHELVGRAVLGQCNAMYCRVELPIPAARQAMPLLVR